jgi:type IV pilus assembly protein PilX
MKNNQNLSTAARERGMALISSLLLLLVVTILAVAMFRGFSIEGKIAGNVREKQRALHAAESAQQYAEWWLTQGTNAQSATTTCAAKLDAMQGDGQICSNTLVSTLGATSVTSVVPWPVSTTYLPASMADPDLDNTPGQGSYWARPSFYIADLGLGKDGGEVYQIDALGYGATASTVAVVESTFSVQLGVPCYSCGP